MNAVNPSRCPNDEHLLTRCFDERGVEKGTDVSALEVRCSIQLSYGRMWVKGTSKLGRRAVIT